MDRSYTRTDEYRKKYSEKFSGENNPMYGKKMKDFMTEDKYQEMLLHKSQALKGKNKGKIVMRHSINLDIIAINPEDVEEKEKLGYVRYSIHKGRRKMINYSTNETVWINVEQIDEYIKLGYSRPIRTRHKK